MGTEMHTAPAAVGQSQVEDIDPLSLTQSPALKDGVRRFPVSPLSDFIQGTETLSQYTSCRHDRNATLVWGGGLILHTSFLLDLFIDLSAMA